MPLFATKPDDGFTTKHPPLLADLGIDGVGMLPLVYGETQTMDILLTEIEYDNEFRSLNNLQDDGINVKFIVDGHITEPLKYGNSPYGVPGRLYIQPCWALKFKPYVNGLSTPIETSVTTSFTQTSQEAESSESSISASLDASASIDEFGISASVSASISGSMTNTVSMQRSMEGSQEKSEAVELAPGSAFAIWDLRQLIKVESIYPLMTGDDSSYSSSTSSFSCTFEALAVQMYIDSCTIEQLRAQAEQ